MSFLPLFGGEQQANDQKTISKCNNVGQLMSGIDRDMSLILSMEKNAEGKGNEENISSNQENKIETSTVNDKESISHYYELVGYRLARIKSLLYDEVTRYNANNQDPNDSPPLLSSLVADIITTHPDIIPTLLGQIPSPNMPFEAKKDISAIFNSLMIRTYLTCDIPNSTNSNSSSNQTKQPKHNNRFAEYILDKYDAILTPIMRGHGEGTPDSALHCGSMLRATLRHNILYQKLLSSNYVYPLLDTYVHVPNFDVASDALETVRDIFLMNRAIASQFLAREYTSVFPRYNKMLQSQNYITRRMSLKLLGEILLDKTNFGVMMKYISSPDNLAIIMMLLSDPSGNIQFEAFHVFKIFVANPGKPEDVVRILTKNKVKLVKYLEQFHSDRESEDDQFRDEKRLILSTLNGLE